MEERSESKRGGTREIFGVLELFNILSEITRIYRCVKMHTLYTPKVTFTLYSIFKNNLVKAKKKIQLQSFHMLASLCSNSFKWGFSSMWIKNFQMYKLICKRQSNQRTVNIHWIIEKERKFQKISTTASLTMPKSWLCESQKTRKFLKRWEYKTTLPVSWETFIWAKK